MTISSAGGGSSTVSSRAATSLSCFCPHPCHLQPAFRQSFHKCQVVNSIRFQKEKYKLASLEATLVQNYDPTTDQVKWFCIFLNIHLVQMSGMALSCTCSWSASLGMQHSVHQLYYTSMAMLAILDTGENRLEFGHLWSQILLSGFKM